MRSKVVKVLHIGGTFQEYELICDVLEEADQDFAVTMAPSLNELAARGNISDYDVVLVDFKLPTVSGLEVAEKIKGTVQNLPVIIIVDDGFEEMAVTALRHGADDYIIKNPPHLQQLALRISAAIEKYRVRMDNQSFRQDVLPNSAKIETLIENNLDAGIVLDGHQIVRYVNPAAEQLFGRASKDWVGRVFGLPIVDDGSIEMEIPGRNGKVIHGDLQMIPTCWRGKPCTLVLIKNVTKRKLADARVRHLNRILAAVRSVNQLLVREKNPHRLIDKTCRLLVRDQGYDSALIVLIGPNGTVQDFAHHGFDEIAGMLGPVLEQEGLPPCYEQAKKRDGVSVTVSEDTCSCCGIQCAKLESTRWCVSLEHMDRHFGYFMASFSASIGELSEEQILFQELAADIALGLYGIAMEKEAQETATALELSESKFRAAFQAAPVWVVLSTLEEGRYIEVNDTFLKTMGFMREEVIGRTSLELNLWVNPHDRTLILSQVKAKGRVRNVEVQRRTKSGAVLDMLFSADLIDYSGERVMVSVSLDVTDSRQLEAQLRQAQKMEAVGRLAGGVAHDFNNMLSVIMGHAEMILLKLNGSDRTLVHVEEILKAAKSSANFTKQLLAFASCQTVRPVVLNMNEAISQGEKMFRRLVGENIHLRFVPGKDLWPVRMDPGQLDQILANLVVNARDAIAAVGSILIETQNVVLDDDYCCRHMEVQPGDYVMLALSDTGMGMDKQTLERVFDPFFTTKPEGEGTGLGLSIVYGIIKQNGGSINAYSEPDRGTSIKIYLPRCREVTEVALPEKEVGVTTGTETILIVEDEVQILDLARLILESQGYTVLTAAAPQQALEQCRNHKGKIHLLLTDVIMPVMNGKELKAHVERIKPGVKTIFMSGYTANVIARQGVLKQKVDFIQKPFSVLEMTSKIREVLDRS